MDEMSDGIDVSRAPAFAGEGLDMNGRMARWMGTLVLCISLIASSSALGQAPDSLDKLLRELKRLENAGQFAEAIPLQEKVLAIAEKALGPNDPSVAIVLNNLARLYLKHGQDAAAVPLYQRALAIDEKALGPNHSSVALALNNLAELYRKQGQYAAAAPLVQRALAIHEKELGLNHPDVASVLNNLALLYGAQGQYDAAAALHQRALAIRKKPLWPNRPDVATSLDNLALWRPQTSRRRCVALPAGADEP